MGVNHEARACRAWPVLTAVANSPTAKITYGQLASVVGVHHRAVRYILGLVQDYCLREKLPPLTIVVVNAQDGLPGLGFIAWDVDDLASGFQQVQAYNWALLGNPFSYAADGATEEELAAALVRRPEDSAEIYALVKARGAAQSIFRRALIQAYESKCAFCGLSFEEVLQAAHIVPWCDCGPGERMAVANGLLLCATHHLMFDSGLVTLGPKGTVEYHPGLLEQRVRSGADRRFVVDLDGCEAFLPSNPAHRPGREFLTRRHKADGRESYLAPGE